MRRNGVLTSAEPLLDPSGETAAEVQHEIRAGGLGLPRGANACSAVPASIHADRHSSVSQKALAIWGFRTEGPLSTLAAKPMRCRALSKFMSPAPADSHCSYGGTSAISVRTRTTMAIKAGPLNARSLARLIASASWPRCAASAPKSSASRGR